MLMCLVLDVEIDQVRNFQVTLRTANDVHLSWDPPEKLTTVLYYVVSIHSDVHSQFHSN
jgi:hypothetical protein